MQLDDFWTYGDTGKPLLPPPAADPVPDVTILDPDLGESAVLDVIRRDLARAVVDEALPELLYGDGRGGLTVGVDAINQGRRHVMPRTLTLG